MGRLLEGNLIDGLGLLAQRVPNFIKDDLAHNKLTYVVREGIRMVDVSNLNKYSILYLKVKQALRHTNSVTLLADMTNLVTILSDFCESNCENRERNFSELVRINNISKSVIDTYSTKKEMTKADLAKLSDLVTFLGDRIESTIESLYYISK